MKKIALMIWGVMAAMIAHSGNVDTVLVHSNVMNKDIKTVVITPTSSRKTRDVRYPVVYLLHGATGNCKYWF